MTAHPLCQLTGCRTEMVMQPLGATAEAVVVDARDKAARAVQGDAWQLIGTPLASDGESCSL